LRTCVCSKWTLRWASEASVQVHSNSKAPCTHSQPSRGKTRAGHSRVVELGGNVSRHPCSPHASPPPIVWEA
jgi:hypothetical protein